MRSVSVVLPESMWAEMPMLRMLAVSEEEAAADFAGAASAAAGIDASPRANRSVQELALVREETVNLSEAKERLASDDDDVDDDDDERKRSDDDDEACSIAASIVDEEEQLMLLHLRAAASAALVAEARMMPVLPALSLAEKERETK